MNLNPLSLHSAKTEKKANGLKGIVTPEMQGFRVGQTDYSLYDVIDKPELRARFANDEFPPFNRMSDNSIFFEPTARIVSPIGVKFVKWFSLTQAKELSHDHNYQFARLMPNGYFMKMNITMSNFGISDFNIEYITPVDHLNLISEYVKNSNVYDSDDAVNKVLAFANFNHNDYPEIFRLIVEHRDTFVNEYLSDINNR